MQCKAMLSSMLAVLVLSSVASAQEVRINGFGDFTAGVQFGDPADADERAAFEQDGEDSNPKNVSRGFGVVGTDFVVTVDINEDFLFLSEINLQLERGGSNTFELDPERMFVDYRVADEFNVEVGLFFTPIGFQNRNHYARAWLMHNVQVAHFFEEELGLMPTHTAGVMVHGEIQLGQEHSLVYALSSGNGRRIDPVTVNYNRVDGQIEDLEFSGLVEWVIPGFTDFRIGLSGWTNTFHSYRIDNIGDTVDTTDPAAEKISLREIGFDPYLSFDSQWLNVLVEGVYSIQKDERGNLDKDSYAFTSLAAQVALNLQAGRLHPYARYERVTLPDGGGPILAHRADGDLISKVYVDDFDAVMLGVGYDLFEFNRVKLEYIRHFNGPRRANGIVAQTAYAF